MITKIVKNVSNDHKIYKKTIETIKKVSENNVGICVRPSRVIIDTKISSQQWPEGYGRLPLGLMSNLSQPYPCVSNQITLNQSD